MSLERPHCCFPHLGLALVLIDITIGIKFRWFCFSLGFSLRSALLIGLGVAIFGLKGDTRESVTDWRLDWSRCLALAASILMARPLAFAFLVLLVSWPFTRTSFRALVPAVRGQAHVLLDGVALVVGMFLFFFGENFIMHLDYVMPEVCSVR